MTVNAAAPVLINGQWRAANSVETFAAMNPATGETLPAQYPVSGWDDIDAALTAAASAAADLRNVPRAQIAAFLAGYADRLEAAREALVEMAHQETGLAKTPRLGGIELPRTTGQLRQAAAAAEEGSWAMPTIDSKLNIRSRLAAIGPVLVMGPNNFPFAFNGVSGGDFAAAIAAGNPVIAKAHPSHPGTTRLLAEQADEAVRIAGLPAGTVQMLYHLANEDGLRLVSHPRLGATAFTGSRRGGLALKAAADEAGRPIYLEMSSTNPVVILPGALRERAAAIADELADSCLGASGQFCTKPNLVVVLADEAEAFIAAVRQRFESRAVQPLISTNVADSLRDSIGAWTAAGAAVVIGGAAVSGAGCRFSNTLLRASGKQFLSSRHALQSEAFGNATLVVVAQDVDEASRLLGALEGNLTGCIYSGTDGGDDALYDRLAPILREHVGRLLNDKMPTGVAVSPAMNHGGPFPSTGHPGFTAVGIPGALRRFAKLECFDNVRPARLPVELRDASPTGRMWRSIDGRWTTEGVVR